MPGSSLWICERRLTTAEILYHLPDHPELLQIYLWQDHCWGIAVDKNGKEILKRTMPITFNLKVAIETTSMLLFQIGIAPVE